MPPDPKPPSRRRRRNAVAGEGKLAKRRTDTAPELPKGFAWLEWTREYWATIWDSPMATRWMVPYDVPALVRLAKLQERALVDDDRKVLSEIRQLEDRFGLSPRGRRLLGWELDDEPETPDASAPEQPSSAGESDASSAGEQRPIDPRRLRAVS